MSLAKPLSYAMALALTSCGTFEDNEWTAMAKSTRFFPDLVVWGSSDTLHVIEAADTIYVMPVWITEERHRAQISGTYTTVTPHGDYRRARLLDAEAGRALQKILGRQRSWFHGFDDTIWIGPVPKNVGYIFRKGKDQLVLLGTMPQRLEGTFNGAPTDGSLEEAASNRLSQWRERYAMPELGTK